MTSLLKECTHFISGNREKAKVKNQVVVQFVILIPIAIGKESQLYDIEMLSRNNRDRLFLSMTSQIVNLVFKLYHN